ncbi:toxin-antitoxin system YwqK family antitoxin [Winogradskyella schleiferi]|uniref:toxin-antitoxin system YwqK family antitoxin n=1 Tax=Winogradskyella schleiferi TaxID=2686078 RepID=UPI0015BEA3E5|nr:toxin-antitoxin system YwqK family antitoxin [Winogradskyella schleiferi]
MKYFFSIIAFLFITHFSFAQSPPDGPYKDYYNSGVLKVEGQFKNGKPDGNWKSYYKNGQVSSLYRYEKGKRNMVYSSFYEDGTLKSKTEEINGEYLVSGFYNSGNLKYERQLKGGYFKIYLENGTLEIEANYEDNELSGEWIRYYENGTIEWVINYEKNERSGVYKHFYKNGNLKLIGENKNDKKEGEEKRYLPNGILEWKGDYNKDRFHNNWIKFDASGKKIEKIKYFYGSVTKSNYNTDLEGTKVPDGVLERAAIYPGCESHKSNKALKKCTNQEVNKVILENFDANLGNNIGLSGKQRIFVKFEVDIYGYVSIVSIKAPHHVLRIETERVMRELPRFKPAMQLGKLVKMPFSIPIVFVVN